MVTFNVVDELELELDCLTELVEADDVVTKDLEDVEEELATVEDILAEDTTMEIEEELAEAVATDEYVLDEEATVKAWLEVTLEDKELP